MPSHRTIDLRIHVHPATGRLCTLEEFEAAGGRAATDEAMMAACARFEARDPACPENIGMQIIKDIEPYRAVASDVKLGDKPVISGRAQHREFLRRNGYIEVGNSFVPNERHELGKADRISDIKRAMGE